MNKYHRFLITFIVAAALLGCMQKTVVPPPAGEFADKPSMPRLEALSPGSRPAPVFGPPQEYDGSPLDQVGRRNLFGVHSSTLNQIALLKNGDESFATRVQLLEKAETSIRIQALIFWGDESGLHIAEILKKKKAEGIDVRVIVDATANLGWQTQWMYFDLKQHGIEVQGYESLYLEWINEIPIPFISPAKDPEAPNHRYHEKMWIVDGETDRGAAVVGGLNIANEYFRVDPSDPSRFWRDQDVIVKGSIVADMVTAFDRNFEHFLEIKESRGALNTDLYWQSTREFLDEFGKLSVPYTTRSDLVERVKTMAQMKPALNYVNARSRFFHNRPRLGESYIQQAYLKLFDNAEREIIICNAYFIPSADFINAVRDAVSRGIRVIILTNSPETNDLPELTMVGRSYYKTILSINEDAETKQSGGKVQIWEWYGWRYDQAQQTEGTIHAKYAVFDRRYSLVGSYNLDPRSEKLNSETAVVFESDILSAKLAQMFYENDLAYSRKVTPQDANEFNDPSDALYKLEKEFGDLFESLL
jgi:putative cardiolipin synthase